jgi:hypothetical protein
MQPKRPISRSSTPIEFAPLILDLEPEQEVKEVSSKCRDGVKLVAAIGGIIIFLMVGGYYWVFKANDRTDIKDSEMTGSIGISTVPVTSAGGSSEKRQILTYGIKSAKLVLENVGGQDIMKVLVQDKAPAGITWTYEWTKNNEPFGKSDSVSGFRRGDNLSVKVIPFDGENYGNGKVLSVEIKNTVPRMVDGQSAILEGKKLTYHLKAVDADGDTLTYSLIDGPSGATIDQKSGAITWFNVPDDLQKFDLKVKINDGQNGEIIYPVTVNFPQPVKEKLTAQK